MKKIVYALLFMVMIFSFSACVVSARAPRAYWVRGHYNVDPYGYRHWVPGHYR